jgi:hypothetical protein
MIYLFLAFCLWPFHHKHVEKWTVIADGRTGIAAATFKHPFKETPSCLYTEAHWHKVRALDARHVEIFAPRGDIVTVVCK